ncbi:hypothetical protein WN51_14002 [Melipona quadrifasciata]|uniref:Uncharacterized protein n=1 Tax=Melipona quadrifasciata TaxID=166423 RepID=A0A0N0U5D9_9HYME|nr:hypothetical protein WN51_14002 [Melipona quadrifasciata]
MCEAASLHSPPPLPGSKIRRGASGKLIRRVNSSQAIFFRGEKRTDWSCPIALIPADDVITPSVSGDE